MSWLKVGAYIWAACGACWVGIALATGLVQSMFVAVGCLIMAAIWSELSGC